MDGGGDAAEALYVAELKGVEEFGFELRAEGRFGPFRLGFRLGWMRGGIAGKIEDKNGAAAGAVTDRELSAENIRVAMGEGEAETEAAAGGGAAGLGFEGLEDLLEAVFGDAGAVITDPDLQESIVVVAVDPDPAAAVFQTIGEQLAEDFMNLAGIDQEEDFGAFEMKGDA